MNEGKVIFKSRFGTLKQYYLNSLMLDDNPQLLWFCKSGLGSWESIFLTTNNINSDEMVHE